MKKILYLLPILLVLILVPSHAAEQELRGVWVSSVYNLDYPSKAGLSADELREEADALLDMAEKCGLNTVVLQVRPTADSLYASRFFPWSSYLSGQQGASAPGGFDPLAYFIKQGHARGIAIHAWCNPYRVTKTSAPSREEALAALCDWHPARKKPELVVYHTDGNLYFNPSDPNAAELILRGMFEIVENYDVDAIHLDDYFYPSTNFDDAAAFAKYGGDYTDLGDFRRASVTSFIKKLHDGIQQRKPSVLLGVSPFGIWANASKNPLGSDTVGGQSYYDHYADSRAWVKQGLVDYISPQLYWHTGASEGEFAELLRWWNDVVDGTNVKLYPGIAAYRLAEATPGSPWEGTREIESQITQLLQSKNASGMIFFRAGSIGGNTALQSVLMRRFTHSESPILSLAVARPASGEIVSSSRLYFAGSSDRTQALTVNGAEITTRSESGYFGILLPLSAGENIFTFQNGTKTVAVTVFRTLANHNEFGSLFPQGNSLIRQGESIPLSCVAPAGSKVYAMVGNRTVPLKRGSDGIWRGSPAAASEADTPVVYVSQIGSFVRVGIARGRITTYSSQNTLSATVAADVCDVYRTTSAADGARGFLYRGMQAPVSCVLDGMAWISGIGYVKSEALSLTQSNAVKQYRLTAFREMDSQTELICTFRFDSCPIVYASYADDQITLDVVQLENTVLPESNLLSISAEKNGSIIRYSLKRKDGGTIDGYRLEPAENGVRLTVKKHVSGPLSGRTIVIDPGHGGTANGAIGVDPSTPEKASNLATALALRAELEKRGATVVLTRSGDAGMSLPERLQLSQSKLPDLFLSLHSNSLSDAEDASAARGVLLFARSELSGRAASLISDKMGAIGRTTDVTTGSALYVCRGEHTVSILIENEFISSPYGYELIRSEIEQSAFCAAIADGLEAFWAD